MDSGHTKSGSQNMLNSKRFVMRFRLIPAPCRCVYISNTTYMQMFSFTEKNCIPFSFRWDFYQYIVDIYACIVYLRGLPSILESQSAKSSFMGSRLASCRLESHWWYCCMSVRPGPKGCFGLSGLHMIPYCWPEGKNIGRQNLVNLHISIWLKGSAAICKCSQYE